MSANSGLPPSFRVALVHDRADIGGGHALLDPRIGMAVGGDGDVGRLLHQRELGGRLDHPAAADDGGGAAQLDPRNRLAEAVDREEADRLLDPDRPRGKLPVAKRGGDAPERILMLDPGAHLGRDSEALANRRLLEEGGEDDRLAVDREERGGEPLASPPLHSGEVIERGAGLDEDRAEAVPPHQRPRLFQSNEALRRADRSDVAGHRLQPRLGGGQASATVARRARLRRRARPERSAGGRFQA